MSGPHRPRQRLPELRTPLPGLLEDRAATPDLICREEDLLQEEGRECGVLWVLCVPPKVCVVSM